MKSQIQPSKILFLCFFAYAVTYIGRLNLSAASVMFEEENILNKQEIGMLGSVFFFIYAIGRIINGRLGDQVPPKIFLIAGLLLSATCNILMSLLPTVEWMYLIWGLNGLFQSMLWGAVLRNVSLAYSEAKSAKRAAIILSISVGVGTLLGTVFPILLTQAGLRQVFWIPGGILLVTALLIWLFLPNSDYQRPEKKKYTYSCLRNKTLLSMLIPAAVHGAIKENITLWAPLLFMEMYHLDLQNAQFYIYLMPAAILAGRLIFPIWYKWCRYSEKWTLLSSFFLCSISLIPFFLFNLPVWLSGCLLSVVSIMMSIVNGELMSVYPINFQSTNEVSTVSGILDCATYIGSALGSAFFGYVISQAGYHGMIGVWIVLSVLSYILMLGIKRKHVV